MLPSYRKHCNFFTLFHTPGSSSSEDYAVAAAASSATWDACCRVQMRLRSPYTLSTRPGNSRTEIISLHLKNNNVSNAKYSELSVHVVGQNLAPRSQAAGNAAYSLEYGLVHASLIRSWGGWGAPCVIEQANTCQLPCSCVLSCMHPAGSAKISCCWKNVLVIYWDNLE
jgi:hypothetical protein